ncbi:MAG: hypothetical protein K0Q95_18 [Bacteroidota bacterium]|nr:hypothetical protein [Bacteroidota bacterium]
MPIQKFSNSSCEKLVSIKDKKTIRLLGVLFSKGFENHEWLEFELVFPKHPEIYNLTFKNVVSDPKQGEVLFYRGNGAVFPVPESSKEIKIRVLSHKNVDFDFVLNYDFYPGSI